jgi:glycosyltransferase involved in cell wall biosynthesis
MNKKMLEYLMDNEENHSYEHSINDKTQPLVSVVMPVFNNDNFVSNSINSILKQSYRNFEFIIVDDGSTDSSAEIIREFNDERIQFIHHDENRGNYGCRNEGINLSKGKYVCVMDSDDEALPIRIETQVAFLEKNKDILAIGSQFELIGSDISFYQPQNYDLIKVLLISNNMFLHPSLLIRKGILDQIEGYNEIYYYSSDYDLVCRLSTIGKIINLPSVLMKYRVHNSQISILKKEKQKEYANNIRLRYLKLLGFSLTTSDEFLLNVIINKEIVEISLNKIQSLFNKITKQNEDLHAFDSAYLRMLFYTYEKASLH